MPDLPSLAVRCPVLCAALLLCACVPAAPEPTPAPRPAPSANQAPAPQPIAPPPSTPDGGHWQDAPQTAGDWHWRLAGAESVADFTAPDGNVQLRLTCTAAGRVELLLPGTVRSNAVLNLRSESVERAVAGTARVGGLAAALDATDPLLDAMALSRGRFAVEAAGFAPLYLPSWPEVTRVIEDCRD